MFDTRAETPERYVPSGGFTSATRKTYTSRPVGYGLPTVPTYSVWTTDLPYGFAQPPEHTPNYGILTLPGLATAYRNLMSVAEEYELRPVGNL